jgi:pSer/pThr/pTyr-binding forkhead associated (FHA) protein
MALLIVEHDGKVQAGVIDGRVVVGRRPEDQIRVLDQGISRIHAWIAVAEDGTHFIADTGSKTGTFVNGERVIVKKALRPGDQIRIGAVLLRLAAGQAIPGGATPIDLRPRPLPAPSPSAGISFDCACGAPVWAPWGAAGRSGTCRACGAPMSVPLPASYTQAQVSPVATSGTLCGVCHGTIQSGEETTRCPACGAVFHVECWTENGGCSVYGCSQVSVLHPPQTPAIASEADVGAPTAGFPWAYALLATSVLGAVAGTLTFGATSLLVAAAALIFLIRNRPQQQRRIVFLSIAVSLAGAVAGIAVSYYWWIDGSTWLPTR